MATVTVYCFAEVLCYPDSMWAAIGAWVQAVGSIAAIFIAYFIAHRQFAEAERLGRQAREASAAQRVEVVRTVFAQVRSFCNLLARRLPKEDLKNQARLIGEFDTEHFDRCAKNFEGLPLMEIPDGELAVYVINAPKAIYDYIEAIKLAKVEAFNFPLEEYLRSCLATSTTNSTTSLRKRSIDR